MAARKKNFHDEKTREKIKTSQLINRLQNHILKNEDMTSTQIRAAEVLMRKTLPDLQSTEIRGDEDNPLNFAITDKIINEDEWESQHCVGTAAGSTESTD